MVMNKRLPYYQYYFNLQTGGADTLVVTGVDLSDGFYHR